MSTTYRTITPGKTQRATAEAIYEHLIAHPKDIPSSASEKLTFQLGRDAGACVEFSDFNGLNLSVFPRTTTEIQVERGWAANHLPGINGALIGNPHSTTPGIHEDDVFLIRIVIGRTLRYHAKEAARVAEQIERRRASVDDAPGARLTPATTH